MNWLDRAIGAVAPGAGLRRARQRQAMAVLARAYEGAKLGRRTEGWVAAGTGANAEIAPAIARLRDRSRDLVRNNPYAAKAVTALVSNMIGTGLLPRAGRRRRSWPPMPTSCGRRSPLAADADGLTDFCGLQALIVRSLVESGAVLVRLRERVEDGLPVLLQLQVLEADQLDTAKTEALRDGGFVVQGIEFEPSAAAAATGSTRRIPAPAAGALVSHRVPADRACPSSSGCGRGRSAACPGLRR